MAAWAVLGVAVVWACGMGSGAVQPLRGLLVLGWTGVGLLWLRVAALWLRAAVRARARARAHAQADRVSLSKQDARQDLGPRAPVRFSSKLWVYVRHAAVWVLIPLAAAVPGSLRAMDGGEHVRQLKQAGAAAVTATVIAASDVREVEDDGDVTGYHADLVLAMPGGPQVTAYGLTVDEPHPGSQVLALWAPSSPQLGAVVNDTKDLPGFVRTGWTWHSEDSEGSFLFVFFALLVGIALVPLSVSTGAADLHDLAWRPLAQTVNAAVLTALYLVVRPFLTVHGVDSNSAGAVTLGFGLVLLVLYLGQSLRAGSVT
ncbi:hypothetical protein [Kitasatospora cinereorecta]|uniref:Uncharacterized protein n=1 Tax=Kitasatospora cinereorecta TaxID=285560 RepID=A0ABW0VBF1_9ACTN